MGGNLQEALTITFWIALIDSPWYFMTAALLKDKLRISKSLFTGLLSGALILYLTAIFLLSFFVNDDLFYTIHQFFYITIYIIIVALFICSFKLFWGKILYIFFLFQALTYMTGSLSFIICQRMYGAEVVIAYRYTPLYPVLILIFNGIAIFSMLRFLGKPLMDILDDINKRSLLYLCAAPVLFFIVQEIVMKLHHSHAYNNSQMLMLLRLLLIFTGIATYTINLLTVRETSKRVRLEANHQFAMNVISSGKDYYEKLTVLSEKLHIQQHDYKYHLNALQKLLDSGDTESSQSYLDMLNKKTSENQIKEYCGSRVINALLDSFAERCANENINFIVSSYLPDKRNFNDYELCVILGNLLENALTACLSLESERIIELRIKLQGDSLGITVKNSFNGDVTVKNGAFVSRKENGGSGIKSVQSILNRYGGDFVPKWDEEFFTVFVVVDITK